MVYLPEIYVGICLHVTYSHTEGPTNAPKISFLGFEPLNVIDHHRDLKRHILGRNRTFVPSLVEILPLVQPVREMKKPKKARKETYSSKLGVRKAPSVENASF